METIDPRWRKSSYSGSNGGGCVEAGDRCDGVMVRDTVLDEASPVLAFSADKWREFIMDVKAS
jgi:hypothetical protein